MIRPDGHAVTITFTDFKVDVVPGFYRTGGGYLIPDTGGPRWISTDPKRHVEIWSEANKFKASVAPQRLILFTTKSRQSAYDFSFMADDVLLFGKESAGVPAAIATACDAKVRLPMQSQVRSMNVATAAALALGEAMRQTASLPS
ncbi:MAG: hypothetical protein H0W65_08350 [Sphingomonas sp.]|nr:hypothetical protein [Sphingomonas sp.]